jgi:hypothetical protein
MNHPNAEVRRSVWSEELVAEHFREKGYQVVRTAGRGPDLTVTDSIGSFTVEVKITSKSSSYGQCTISAVQPARRGDTFIAVVFDNGYIHLEPMNKHLEKCWPSGGRDFTELYNAKGQRISGAGHGGYIVSLGGRDGVVGPPVTLALSELD